MRAAWLVQALIVSVAAGWLFHSQGQLMVFGASLVAAMATALLGVRLLSTWNAAILAGLMILIATTFVQFADGHVLWSIDRFDRHALAGQVAARVGAQEPLFSFNLTPVMYIFATGRAIPEVRSLSALEHLMAERGVRDAYLLMRVKRLPELASRFRVAAVTLMPDAAAERAGLYRISTTTN